MIITCDADNVLNNLGERMLEVYNARHSKNIRLSDLTSYHFVDCLPKADADGLYALFKERDLWESLKPLPGAREALKRFMKQGHKVYIATATDVVNFEWKCEWFSSFYPFIPTDNIIRIMDKSLLRTDVLIEDNIDNLISNFCDRICLDYPYNRSITKDFSYDINRAHNWSEIEKIIDDIERKNREWVNQ